MDKIRADKQRRRNHSVVSEGVEEGGQKMRNNEPGEYKLFRGQQRNIAPQQL